MEIFDISQTLQQGIAIWPGDPEYGREPILRIAGGESSNVSVVHIGTHTGTHIDAPLHVDDSGTDTAGIPVHTFFGPARVIPFSGSCIRAEDLFSLDWRGVERVLFRTRSSGNPENLFDRDFVCLNESASEFLAGKGLLLVGTDAPSVDPFDSIDLPAHKALLRNGTVILENLRLGHVPPGDYTLICLPLKLSGADGSPVRAVLWK
jgi:arylformamidase